MLLSTQLLQVAMLVAMPVLVRSVNYVLINNLINKCIAIAAAPDTIPAKPANIQFTATASILNNIYNDSEDNLLATPSSVQLSDSILQVPRVPRLQAKPSSWSWVFAHLNTTILDTFYISKRTRKQTQDRLY
jgi:hypothetical protein